MKKIATLLTILLLGGMASVQAEDVKVSQIPLSKAASQAVAPNLLFILDDSGSMAWDYTPDFVDDSLCRQNNSTTSLTGCRVGMPPFMSGAFNKQYYDPKIRYSPGVYANGDSYPEMNAANTGGWKQVPNNGYSTSSTKVNILEQYTDRRWCDGSDCKINSTYRYPDSDYTDTSTVNNASPYYYNLKPLYCTTDDATNCSTTKSATHAYEVPYRWCSNSALTTCQAKKTSTFKYPSFNAVETGGVAVLSFDVSGFNNTSKNVTSLKYDGVELLKNLPLTQSDVGNNTDNCRAMAQRIVDNQITTSSNKFTLTRSSCKVTLTAKEIGSWANDASKLVLTGSLAISNKTVVTPGVDGEVLFTRVNIQSGQTKYQVDGEKPATRTDCTTYADGCSYAEEMTNFANWYAYYRTRLLMMKTAASQAFKDIDKTFRVGFTQINQLSNRYVNVQPFDASHRTTWYDKLLTASTSGSTPLRGALSFAGRLFAGQNPNGVNDDPMQYSCQQNFALLTTDGYWNGNSSGSGVLDLQGNVITNQDASGDPPYKEGSTGTVPSLADTAMYFYQTDLRDPALGNCTSPSTGADVCENNSPVSADNPNNKQHMVTFSLGLGVDGELRYRRDYKTATSGDFYQLKQGNLQWPAPTNDAAASIDDLWHAAVNGRGQYFSAKDPAVLVSSLKEALANIAAQYGAGAAAATSTMEPVAGDNFAYVATYTTGKWTGNLEARLIDLATGNVGLQAQWCAENITADPVKGILACTGSMAGKVGANADTRKILFNANGVLQDFNFSNLSTAGLAGHFDVTRLNQYPSWTAEYKAAATAEKLINYLRGQTGFDLGDDNNYRLFRMRETVLGDFVGSAPKYVCKASATYTDEGYEAFAESLGGSGACTRTPVIYIGGNDGMLHAFNGQTGAELWAYVPTPVLPQMWRLADNTYGNDHRFFVDGPVTVGDICVSGCGSEAAVWKTVLVGALGAGVANGDDPLTADALSGYFAMDVTNPEEPTLLWEVTSADATLGSRIGFALGEPWLGKLENGQWVVMLSSGINPQNEGAALVVLDAYQGTVVRTIDIAGSEGFSRFSPQFVEADVDQTVSRVYGGDLLGNVWRINPNSGSVVKVMTGSQPFTTAPELTVCNEKTVLYIGSGKFLEASDMTDKTPQSFYGFVDDYENAGTVAKSQLEDISSTGKTSGDNEVGWYVNFTDIPANGGAERLAMVDPKLEGNIITFPTNIPESGICLASGRSKLYQLPIKTCTTGDVFPNVLNVNVTDMGNSLVVGLTSIKLPDGTIKLIATGSDGKITSPTSGAGAQPAPYSARRVTWRELLRD